MLKLMMTSSLQECQPLTFHGLTKNEAKYSFNAFAQLNARDFLRIKFTGNRYAEYAARRIRYDKSCFGIFIFTTLRKYASSHTSKNMYSNWQKKAISGNIKRFYL